MDCPFPFLLMQDGGYMGEPRYRTPHVSRLRHFQQKRLESLSENPQHLSLSHCAGENGCGHLNVNVEVKHLALYLESKP